MSEAVANTDSLALLEAPSIAKQTALALACRTAVEPVIMIPPAVTEEVALAALYRRKTNHFGANRAAGTPSLLPLAASPATATPFRCTQVCLEVPTFVAKAIEVAATREYSHVDRRQALPLVYLPR